MADEEDYAWRTRKTAHSTWWNDGTRRLRKTKHDQWWNDGRGTRKTTHDLWWDDDDNDDYI